MDIRIIRAPSTGTLRIIQRRLSSIKLEDIDDLGAIGLLQGKVMDMLYIADIAEKTAGVCVEDIRGNCPTTMATLAIFGSVEAVETAIQEIRRRRKEDGR